MDSLTRIDVIDLFPGERAALLSLLRELSADDWAAPTACAGWSVKDVALHLLADDVNRLADRDEFDNPSFGWPGLDLSNFSDLVAAIDRQNAQWVEGTRRISPRVLITFLTITGDETYEYFRTLDLSEISYPVDWAGPEPAPDWLDIAREYTERWVHQQHIRDAVRRPGLKEPEWFAPVLATFVYGLRRSLADAPADESAIVRLTIRGEAGGTWNVRRDQTGWAFIPVADSEPTAEVELDQDTAWRLFTRGLAKETARRTARMSGDAALADAVLDTVSILA